MKKIVFFLIFYLLIFSCNSYYSFDKLNKKIIDSNGKIFKESLHEKKIQDLKITDSNNYYFYGMLYYLNFGFDKWSNYFFWQGISTENLFQKESFNYLLKIYIREKEWENLKLLLSNYRFLINKDYEPTLDWFITGKKPESFFYFPKDIDFLNIIDYILEIDENSFKEEKDSILKEYIYSLLFENLENEYLKDFIAKVINIRDKDFILKVIYSFLSNDKIEFKKHLNEALKESVSYKDFDYLRKMSIKLNCRKDFFNNLKNIYLIKDIYAEYFYLIDLIKFERNPKSLFLLKKFYIKLFSFKSDIYYKEMDYNIRQIILNNEIGVNNSWINNVFSLVNDYPERNSSLSFLNLSFRSAIYQKKVDILLRNIDKLDFNRLDEYNKTSIYYLLSIIDEKNRDKWKKLLEEYPLSYGYLRINNGINHEKILKERKRFKQEDFSELGRILLKKIDYYLLFNNTSFIFEINKLNEILIGDKYEIYRKLYFYYLNKKDYYEALRYAILSAVTLYGKDLKEIDIETLKEIFPLHYKEFIFKYCSEYEIEPAFAFGIIREESRYSPTIVSVANAIGLMQLIPNTANFIAKKINIDKYDLTEPEDNIKLGISYLKFLKDHYFKEKGFILAGYNAGQGRAKKWYNTYKDFSENLIYELIPIAETRNYIRKVLRSYYVYYYLIALENNSK